MEQLKVEEGNRVAKLPRSGEDESNETSCRVTLRHWIKAWMCYNGVLDAFLSVAVYLSAMPQYVSLPYLASEHASVAAVLVQLVGYPLLMTIVAGKAQILLMMVAEVATHADENYIVEMCSRKLMMLFNLSEESREKVERFLQTSFLVGFIFGIVYGIYLAYSGSNFGVISGILLVCCTMTTIFAYIHYFGMILNICRSEYKVYEALPPQQAVQHSPMHPLSTPTMTRDAMTKGTTNMLIAFLGQLAVGLLVWFQIIDKSFLIISTALGTVFYALAFSHFFPSMVRQRCWFFPCTSCFWLVIGILVFFAIVFSLLPALSAEPDLRLTAPIFQPGRSFNATYLAPGQLAGFAAYPACNSMSWIKHKDDGKELQLLDLLVFAKAVYWTHDEDVMAEVGNATYNTELWPVQLEQIQNVGQVARIGVFKLPSAKTRIVSIRGTSQASDWLFNADVWGPSVLLMFVKSVMPLGSLFPLSWSRTVLAPDIRYLLGLPPPWQEVHEKIMVAHQKSVKDGYALILTGHSLGGGMAELIGSVEGIRSATFSPVGQAVTFNRVSADVRLRQLPIANTAVAVIPSGDIVPLIDTQLGVNQRIGCTTFNPIACHSLPRTACELYRKCGDPRNRSIAATCEEKVGSDWRMTPWEHFIWYE